jgi:hypothetical protein
MIDLYKVPLPVMALSRFEARRDAVVHEANAIGARRCAPASYRIRIEPRF